MRGWRNWPFQNMKSICFALIVCVCELSQIESSIAQSAKTNEVVYSPYAKWLPQTDPVETNRIEFPAGYSIVSPAGWMTRTIPIEDWFKKNVADQIEIAGSQMDEYKPQISIQHLGLEDNKLYMDWLQSNQTLPDGWSHIEFQGQPALGKFLPGYGSHRAKRGSYQPWLSQYLFFEREGNGFRLEFQMKNADKDKPYYTKPLPIIVKYFETFRFKPKQK